MTEEKKLDQFLSMLVLILFAVVVVLKLIITYAAPESAGVLKAMDIIKTVIMCLMFCVVLYNAMGWTENWIFRIIFIAITLFLIATAIACQVDAVREFFITHEIPIIL